MIYIAKTDKNRPNYVRQIKRTQRGSGLKKIDNSISFGSLTYLLDSFYERWIYNCNFNLVGEKNKWVETITFMSHFITL